VAVDAAVRPIFGAFYISMLHGVVMDILHMVGKIGFVADTVFPKTPLPNGLLLLVGPAAPHGGALFGGHFGGKSALDVAPVGYVIAS
jgi:hypothetical protein